MRKRDSACSYEWYATTPFSFDYDVSVQPVLKINFFHFQQYYVIIYGSSEFGSNWKRNFYVSTVGQRPPLPPPPATCDLNVVKQDTLFLIDSSLKDSNVTFRIVSFKIIDEIIYFTHLAPTICCSSCTTVQLC